MADSIFHLLSDFFARYGYWVVFSGVMVENAGLPIPGETVVLFAGYLAFHGKLRLAPAILVAIAGATLGTTFGFWIGRYGGTAFVDHYLRRIPGGAKRYDKAQRVFLRYGQWAVFAARFIAGLRVFVGILAGVLLMPFPRFLLFNFLGAAVWAPTIAGLGYSLGGSWDRLVRVFKQLDRVVLAVIAVVALILLVAHLVRRRNASKTATINSP